MAATAEPHMTGTKIFTIAEAGLRVQLTGRWGM